jgi:hypothetical protein
MTIAWHCRDCNEQGTSVVDITMLTRAAKEPTLSGALDNLFGLAIEEVRKCHPHDNIGIYNLGIEDEI